LIRLRTKIRFDDSACTLCGLSAIPLFAHLCQLVAKKLQESSYIDFVIIFQLLGNNDPVTFVSRLFLEPTTDTDLIDSFYSSVKCV